MSTRCTINFMEGKALGAKIYRHSDGYPERGESGVQSDLKRFFQAVKAQCDNTSYGTRFGDPYYLAAKFIVWQAGENTRYANRYDMSDEELDAARKANPLNFGSIGVMMEDPGDIAWKYFLDCDNMDENGFPTVTYERA